MGCSPLFSRGVNEVNYDKPLLSAEGIVLMLDSSWSIVVADISRTATSPTCATIKK